MPGTDGGPGVIHERSTVAVGDHSGYLYNPEGFNAGKLAAHVKTHGAIAGYEAGQPISREEFFKTKADIFVPGQGPSMVASSPRMSRDALMRARAVLVNFRDNVQREIMRGATEEQAVAAIQLPEYRTMVGYDQQRAVLVRRMYQDLKGQIR